MFVIITILFIIYYEVLFFPVCRRAPEKTRAFPDEFTTLFFGADREDVL